MAAPQKRMSPQSQSSYRDQLAASMKNVETDDPEMNSLLKGEEARRERFAIPERLKAKPLKPQNPIAAFIGMFTRKKPAAPKGGK